MSFPALTWAIRQELPMAQKMVLLMMADRHNSDTGRCDPSMDRLARDCGCTRRCILDNIHKLQAAGYLTIFERRPRGIKVPHQYRLHLGFGRPASVRDYVEPDVNEIHIGDVNEVRNDVNDVPPRCERRSHKPVIKKPIYIPTAGETTKKSSTEQTSQALAKPADVNQQTWDDFNRIRNDKRMLLTATGLDRIRTQAGKAGLSLEDALGECCERTWGSFKANWLEREKAVARPSARPAHNTNKWAAAAAAIFDDDQTTPPGVIDV